MAGLFGWLGKSSGEIGQSALKEIFPLSLQSADFVKADILSTYLKILTDTVERTHGLSKKYEPLLWDNCVQTEANEGLVHLLARAMVDKADLFLVFTPSVGVLRKATFEEQEKIRKDYKDKGESALGVFISFKHYKRTDMLLIYSNLEYCILSSLHKTLNISKAVQVKVNDLRSSVALADAEVARSQAQSIAAALRDGNDVLLDKEDEITTATPETSATEKAISFLDAKRAYLLGLPMSYISGIQTSGLNSTGEADTMAVERGLKQYFVSIVQPTIKALFKEETEFKSQDFRQMGTALEVLKTFELTSNEIMSTEAKKEIIARVFDLDPDEEEKNLEADAKQAEEDAANAPTPPAPGREGQNQPPPRGGQQPQGGRQ